MSIKRWDRVSVGAEVYVNGKKIAGELDLEARSPAILVEATAFLAGDNRKTVFAKPFANPPNGDTAKYLDPQHAAPKTQKLTEQTEQWFDRDH